MSETTTRVLVIGYGNPGRLDDGLGPAAADRVAAASLPGVTVDSDYQLQIEDAAAIAEHDVVIFVDAAVEGPAPFFFQRVEPKADLSFTSHSVSQPALLAMARDHFGAEVRGYALGIRGEDFDAFGERLSERARDHLNAAVPFLLSALRRQTFDPTEAGAHHAAAASLV